MRSRDGDEYLGGYVDAPTLSAAKKQYGEQPDMETGDDGEEVQYYPVFSLATDEEVQAHQNEEWQETLHEAEMEARRERMYFDVDEHDREELSQTHKLPRKYREKLTDEQLKAIIKRGRVSGAKKPTETELRSVKGTTLTSRCMDCGAPLPYTTRPHRRCAACQAKHRRSEDRERKRISRG